MRNYDDYELVMHKIKRNLIIQERRKKKLKVYRRIMVPLAIIALVATAFLDSESIIPGIVLFASAVLFALLGWKSGVLE
ncbi:hypothetical protein [Proteiniclasticum sp.]|uniref:hypothetical protein n=1 Tax=Proteiniclasticum sp. TaxID=2053595 RepID=UPI002898867F|nr:hypothetical protein [Proteiniclasticum sp.]